VKNINQIIHRSYYTFLRYPFEKTLQSESRN
jgi:hypothetical protein